MLKLIADFFTGKLFSQILIWGLAALVSTGVLWFVYIQHVNAIKSEALAEYNRVQLQATLNSQMKLTALLEQNALIIQSATEALNSNREQIRQSFDAIDQTLNSRFTNDDRNRPASPLLRETVRQLRGQAQ
jgi:hypothetical protein